MPGETVLSENPPSVVFDISLKFVIIALRYPGLGRDRDDVRAPSDLGLWNHGSLWLWSDLRLDPRGNRRGGSGLDIRVCTRRYRGWDVGLRAEVDYIPGIIRRGIERRTVEFPTRR